MHKFLEKKYLIIYTTLLLFIVLGESIVIFYSNNKEDCVCETEICEIEERETFEEKIITIDIKGAVKKPGVYTFNKETIISEAINAAGGFKSNAYTNNINLSKKVFDELVIYVYTKTEYNNLKNDNQFSTCKEQDLYHIDTCVESGSSLIVNSENNSEPESNVKETGRININNASKESLMTIPGIGSSKADSIIEYRSEDSFKKVEDIMNVSGIGQALYDKIKEYITV